MKNLFSILFITILFGCTTTQISKPSYFETVKPRHKIIAILPAYVKLFIPEYKKGNTSDEDIKNAEMELSCTIQNEMYKWLQKNKYTVQIQDIRYSNTKLFSHGLSFLDYNKLPKDSIAKILEVDAVVFCITDLTKVDYNSVHIFLDFTSPLGAITSVVGNSLSLSQKPDHPNGDIGLYFTGRCGHQFKIV